MLVAKLINRTCELVQRKLFGQDSSKSGDSRQKLGLEENITLPTTGNFISAVISDRQFSSRSLVSTPVLDNLTLFCKDGKAYKDMEIPTTLLRLSELDL